MGFLQRISLMITSLIILHTIPSTTSISITPDAPTMILIDSICVNTKNMYYCEQSIISKLGNPHAEIKTIADIAAFNAVYLITSAGNYIRDKFIPIAENPLVKNQLVQCLATYRAVQKLLEGAYLADRRGDYSDMRHYQSSVLGMLDNCKTDFDYMVRTNWGVRLMINISLLATRQLPAQ
ncbi:putative pectinesterase inhibitor domain-containing protein [Arabidopsis thaliana]